MSCLTLWPTIKQVGWPKNPAWGGWVATRGASQCLPSPQLYVQAGSWGWKTQLLWLTIQLLFFSLALFSGYIPILDYQHHPCDSVFGFLQEALVAF